jgi:hypothetical protein
MMEKYGELCHALQDAGYTPATVHQYLSSGFRGKIVVLRHDVDRRPENAMRMAELEHSLGICSTYYFRYPYTFKPEIIKQVLALGHEVGYHYEVLAKAKGDHASAIALFSQELEAFKAICDVRTICMHGSPLSPCDNRDLWKKYDFRDFGVEGEAYLSIAEKGFRYLTDTGRGWSGKHSLRDAMPGMGSVPLETTDELISWIRSAEENLYMTVHPERWASSRGEWITGFVKDRMMNIGKIVLRR